MQIRHLCFLLCFCFLLGLWCVAAEAQEAQGAEKARQAEVSREPGGDSSEFEFRRELEQAGEKAEEVAERAGREFSAYLDEFFSRVSPYPGLRWAVLVVGLLGGGVSLLLGWALLRAFFVPVVTVSGLITGGFMGYSVAAPLAASSSGLFSIAAAVAGMVVGAGFFLFAAVKARPFAALLFVLAPFLIISCVLFPFDSRLGLAVFAAGVLLGMASMAKLRPLAAVGSSVLGAGALMVGWRMLAGLTIVGFVSRSFRLLMRHPLMLVVVWCMIAVLGIGVQLTAGPGELEGEEAEA